MIKRNVKQFLNGNIPMFPDTEKLFLSPGKMRNGVERRICCEKLPASHEVSLAMADPIHCACYDPEMNHTSTMEMRQAQMNVANSRYQITKGYAYDNSKPDIRIISTVSDPKSSLDVNMIGSSKADNLKKMFQEYRGKAIFGDVESQYHLAECYKMGSGTEKNLLRARKWYLSAWSLGKEDAAIELFWLYVEDKDNKNALSVLKKLLKCNNWRAALIYANLYKDGFLVNKSLIKYNYWLKRCKKYQLDEIRRIRAKKEAKELKQKVNDFLMELDVLWRNDEE